MGAGDIGWLSSCRPHGGDGGVEGVAARRLGFGDMEEALGGDQVLGA